MNFLKKAVLIIATSGLSVILFATASLWILNHTVLKPTEIKRWVKDSGLYTNIIPAAADVIDNPSTESTIPFKDPAILDAGKAAFNYKVLQSATEQLIDQTTAWLDGTNDSLKLNIDISAARNNFAKGIGGVAASRLVGLPTCGVKIPVSYDAFSVACLPRGVNPTVQGDRLANELIANRSFFGDGTITDKMLGITTQKQKALTFVPHMYQARNLAFVILSLLVLGLTLIVIFFSEDKRGGITKVAGVYIFICIALLSTAALLPYLTKALAPASNSISDKAFVDKIDMPLVVQVRNSVIAQHILVGAVIGGVGLILVLYLIVTKRSRRQARQDIAIERPFNDDPIQQKTDV